MPFSPAVAASATARCSALIASCACRHRRRSTCHCVGFAARCRLRSRRKKHGRLGWGHPGHSAGAPAVGPYGCATQDSRCCLIRTLAGRCRVVRQRSGVIGPTLGRPIARPSRKPARHCSTEAQQTRSTCHDADRAQRAVVNRPTAHYRLAPVPSRPNEHLIIGRPVRRQSAHSPRFEQLVKAERDDELGVGKNDHSCRRNR